MLRLRLAFVALASGLLFMLSGCCSLCEEGRLFPRLFRHHALRQSHGNCECMHGGSPVMMDAAHGPTLLTPGTAGTAAPIPIRDVPASQPPQVFKVPQATPTPFVPSN
ncbi:MAG: hypothetical protein FJ303_06310 [Planctomycetes bacterium]|nr:hypothetical protein [Planctomycetota bacterium]